VSPTSVGLMGGSGAGAGITGGVATGAEGAGAAGGGMGVGAMSAIAGVLGKGLQAINPKNDYGISNDVTEGKDFSHNTKGTDFNSYDTKVNMSQTEAAKELESAAKSDAALSTVESIPVIGGFASLGRGLHQSAKSILGAEEESVAGSVVDNIFNPAGYAFERFKDGDTWEGIAGLVGLGGFFSGDRLKREAEERKKKLNNEFNALQSNTYSDINATTVAASFGNEREMPSIVPYGGNLSGSSEIQSIDIPMDHENNKFQGVKIGEDSNGKPNLAEVGEEVYKNFVFTDRF